MNKELILQDKVIKELLDYYVEKPLYSTLDLVGGAVIDLLEGRKPKDYDFIGGGNAFKKVLEELGYKWAYETKTSSTYKKESIAVQILKTKKTEFDFKISQASFSLTKTRKLDVDELSFNNKVLIPLSFDNKTMVVNSLKRKIHWEKKGYRMPDETYLSLCNALYKNQSLSS